MRKIWNWLLGWLFYSDEPATEPAPVAPTGGTESQRRPAKKDEFAEDRTLGALLDNISSTFAAASQQLDYVEWPSVELERAAWRVGMYVPHPWLLDVEKRRISEAYVPDLRRLPSIFSVSMPTVDRIKTDNIIVSGVLGMKVNRPPLWAVPIRGGEYVYYQIVLIFSEAGKEGKRNSFSFVAGINKATRTIGFCKTISRVTRNVGGFRGLSYTSTQAGKCAVLCMADMDDKGYEFIESIKALIGHSIIWWMGREDRWSVAVTKGRRRVTFSVDPSETKTFFKDRQKTAIARDGKAKRIIHLVGSHTRKTKRGQTAVKQHIRGIRSFAWRGYQCDVTAPRFNGYLASSFDIEAEADVDVKHTKRGAFLSAPQLADRLAAMERGALQTDRKH